MKIDSPLNSKEYLHQIRNHLGSFWEFGGERFTGFVLGRFFWVTYHSGYEWNRKITNEKNRAWGFVKDTKDGCRVCGFRTFGFLDPLMFLLLFLFAFGLSLFFIVALPEFEYVEITSREIWIFAVIAFCMTCVGAITSVFHVLITERGQEGQKCLLALLHYPDDPYAHVREF